MPLVRKNQAEYRTPPDFCQKKTHSGLSTGNEKMDVNRISEMACKM